MWPTFYLLIGCGCVTFLTTVIFSFFTYQCIFYRHNRVYFILTTVAFVNILGSCLSCYAYLILISAANDTIETYANEGLALIRMVAALSQAIFFVWRLHFTFVNSKSQLSRLSLTLYHILMVVYVFCALGQVFFLIVNPQLKNSTVNLSPMYIIIITDVGEISRLLIIFSVSCQFANKLIELIVTQHININTGNSNGRFSASRCTFNYDHKEDLARARLERFSITNTSTNTNTNNNSYNYNYDYNNINDTDTITSTGTGINAIVTDEYVYGNDNNRIHIQSDSLKFISAHATQKLINTVSKLTLLATLDFIILVLYISQTSLFEWYYIISSNNNSNIYQILQITSVILNVFMYLVVASNVWLSFMFADQQYQCLCKYCHICCANCFFRMAKNEKTMNKSV